MRVKGKDQRAFNHCRTKALVYKKHLWLDNSPNPNNSKVGGKISNKKQPKNSEDWWVSLGHKRKSQGDATLSWVIIWVVHLTQGYVTLRPSEASSRFSEICDLPGMMNLLCCSSSSLFLLWGFIHGHRLFLQLIISSRGLLFNFLRGHPSAFPAQILSGSDLQVCWVILVATVERDKLRCMYVHGSESPGAPSPNLLTLFFLIQPLSSPQLGKPTTNFSYIFKTPLLHS